MPTEVMEVEATRLPETLVVDARYDAAFILVRWNGHPVGRVTLPVREGRIGGVALREAVLANAWSGIEARRLHELAGGETEAFEPGCGAAPSISPAVCTRDRPDDLERCLTALERALWTDEQDYDASVDALLHDPPRFGVEPFPFYPTRLSPSAPAGAGGVQGPGGARTPYGDV